MFWFKSRRTQRKAVKQELRLGVEQLESRVATGTIWSPGSAIDISGITNHGGVFAAGQIVEFSIIGTGNDFDQWYSYGPGGFSGGQTQDTVTITWSGASCQILDQCRRALCQLGSAGAPGDFSIVMQADDGGTVPAGDSGSRNDVAVQFVANVQAVWVDIHLGFSTMDPKDQLSFGPFDGFIEANATRNLGYTDPSTGETTGYRW